MTREEMFGELYKQNRELYKKNRRLTLWLAGVFIIGNSVLIGVTLYIVNK